jgi:hypothetical protein
MGRPSTYPEGEELEMLMASILVHAQEGKSITQISMRVNVPKTTLLRWADDHEEFRTVLTRAKELELTWWEDQAQGNLTNREFNANLWNKSVTSRFRKEYGDKITAEHTGADGAPLESSPRDLARAVLDILREAKVEKQDEPE